MSLSHEDKVKKKELLDGIKDAFDSIVVTRKENNIKILDTLKSLVEENPSIRFEQLLSCLIGELDFNREPSSTLNAINQSIKVYGWKK